MIIIKEATPEWVAFFINITLRNKHIQGTV